MIPPLGMRRLTSARERIRLANPDQVGPRLWRFMARGGLAHLSLAIVARTRGASPPRALTSAHRGCRQRPDPYGGGVSVVNGGTGNTEAQSGRTAPVSDVVEQCRWNRLRARPVGTDRPSSAPVGSLG